LNLALTSGQDYGTNLTAVGYSKNTSLSTAQMNVYQRTISSPFTNQTVTAQIWIAATVPTNATVIGQSTIGQVTQQSTTHVNISLGGATRFIGLPPAAIISDNPGTTQTSFSKDTDCGNVCINGDKTGPIIVDGGDANAVIANGRVNVDTNYAKIPTSAISATNYNTSTQIADYTNPGSTNQLFDFGRFIAVADGTRNTYNTNTDHSNHFKTLIGFKNAVKAAQGNFMEGVIAVDITSKDLGTGIDPTDFGNYPLNVHGTVVFNFTSDVKPLDKIINTATMNINPADLSHLVATNSSTYTSGYPPVYTTTNQPYNIDISKTLDANGKPYVNFTAQDDMPAMMYNTGIFDIHGNVNISGVLYSPSFFEIENKQDGQIQYFKGVIVTGGGIYYENVHHSTSIISYDANVFDFLAARVGLSSGSQGVYPTYWE
jgi:hypothetical protein